MVQYKLIYFNSRGLAEISRLVFKLADVEFEDVRVDRATQWDTLKKDIPLAALPILEVDGAKYSQSAAIARFLAREFDLVGTTPVDGLLIDELQETTGEMLQKELMKIYGEQDTDKKKELAKIFAEGPLQKYMDFFEMRLKQNNDGTGFYVGDKITFGDLIVYYGLTYTDEFLTNYKVDSTLSSRKLLVSLKEKVESTPRIAQWLKDRPVTPY